LLLLLTAVILVVVFVIGVITGLCGGHSLLGLGLCVGVGGPVVVSVEVLDLSAVRGAPVTPLALTRRRSGLGSGRSSGGCGGLGRATDFTGGDVKH
jgi:hypothetical protein